MAHFIATKLWRYSCSDKRLLILKQVMIFYNGPDWTLSTGLCNSRVYLDVVRSRDAPVLEKCDIVVDVGAVYDPERHRYDHHQREFTEVFGHGFSTKLSSAGLVYKSVSTFLDLPPVLIIFLDTLGKKSLNTFSGLLCPTLLSTHSG